MIRFFYIFSYSILLIFIIIFYNNKIFCYDKVVEENTLKISYIYNFLKLVHFPHINKKESIDVCVLGENPFGEKIKILSEKKINDKKILFTEKITDDNITNCNVIFISRKKNIRIEHLFLTLENHPILTISDSPELFEMGTIINFYIEDEKLRFEINLDRLKNSGLIVDPRLLNLSRIKREKKEKFP